MDNSSSQQSTTSQFVTYDESMDYQDSSRDQPLGGASLEQDLQLSPEISDDDDDDVPKTPGAWHFAASSHTHLSEFA